MSAQAAARLGDEIAHEFGLAAMIAGAVAGAVVGVAIVEATAVTGGLAAVIIAGCVAGGGLAMGQIASGLKTIFNLPEPTSGILGMESPNVLTNLRPAARAVLDFAAGCTGIPINHFPMMAPVPLAEGSSTVIINGMPASRLKSKLVCGAHVKSASPDVVIGGETVRMLPVFDLEGWFKTGLEILGMGALIAGGLFAAVAGVAALGTYAVFIVGGGLVFEGLGQLGDALGPGYRDLFQGVAGMGLLLAGPKMAARAPREPTPSELARSWQGKGDYPGIDRYRDITLKKGAIIYAGDPGQGSYYTTRSALARLGGSQQTLFQGLQVKPHDVYGYRPNVRAYEVTADTPAAMGITSANPQHGAGGLPQIFVPELGNLKPLDVIPLKVP
jgi:uncharacterized Zn-binding protein involved in type VI secretion